MDKLGIDQGLAKNLPSRIEFLKLEPRQLNV